MHARATQRDSVGWRRGMNKPGTINAPRVRLSGSRNSFQERRSVKDRVTAALHWPLVKYSVAGNDAGLHDRGTGARLVVEDTSEREDSVGDLKGDGLVLREARRGIVAISGIA